jgi:catalase-peroxidase
MDAPTDPTKGSGECPVSPKTLRSLLGRTNRDWWPTQIPLDILHQHGAHGNPMATTSTTPGVQVARLPGGEARPDRADDRQPALVAGGLRPLRPLLHPHGLAQRRQLPHRRRPRRRLFGGQRFAPLNSWPDNGNLDKARRLLWPIKQKYGRKLSWADLMILAGNVAIESMGGPVFGFGGGRADVWEPERTSSGAPEEEWLGETRIKEEAGHAFENPLAAVQHGLIYVNPEGPGGKPDQIGSARDIRETFSRMGMNDEETVALIAGGHTFGKAHGAGDASKVGREPEGSDIAAQGFGWANSHGTGLGDDTITSGLEGPWTPTPIKWDDTYFRMLLDYDYELEKSPSGAHQWRPINQGPETMAPGAHSPDRQVPTMMSTADIALKVDPAYAPSRRSSRPIRTARRRLRARLVQAVPPRHGPQVRYLGPEVPAET